MNSRFKTVCLTDAEVFNIKNNSYSVSHILGYLGMGEMSLQSYLRNPKTFPKCKYNALVYYLKNYKKSTKLVKCSPIVKYKIKQAKEYFNLGFSKMAKDAKLNVASLLQVVSNNVQLNTKDYAKLELYLADLSKMIDKHHSVLDILGLGKQSEMTKLVNRITKSFDTFHSKDSIMAEVLLRTLLKKHYDQ